jgi:ribosomal protein L25 (general stress protein Ctc)
MFSIKAKKRDESVKVDALRKGGEIPAVFYGAGKKATSISVPTVEFKKVWRDAGDNLTANFWSQVRMRLWQHGRTQQHQFMGQVRMRYKVSLPQIR